MKAIQKTKTKGGNYFKIFLFVLLLVPAFLLSGCSLEELGVNSVVSVVSIEKTGSEGDYDIYTITYSDDSTSTFTIQNGTDGADGTDGEDLTLDDIYASAVENGYTGTYWEFLQEYLSVSIENNLITIATSKALLSTVSIYAEFPVITEVSSMFSSNTTEVKSTTVSAGSGVIYDLNSETGEAYIITNYHVVYNTDNATEDNIASEIYSYLYGSEYDVSFEYASDGTTYLYDSDGYPIVDYGDSAIECEYIGGSMVYDIAILKVTDDIFKTGDYQAVEVADSYSVGETAIAIGNPEAEGISVTNGVVSVDSEYITMTGADDETTITFRVMRIDTAVNSGNSGGGLFNDSGELIGIVNAKIIDEDVENIGYALPMDLVVKVADNIIYNYEENGLSTVGKLYLGISLKTANSSAYFDEDTATTKITEDVFVNTVETDSYAESLGFEAEDEILSVQINSDTTEINRMYELVDSFLNARVGDQITITLVRDGVEQDISFVVLSANIKTIA